MSQQNLMTLRQVADALQLSEQRVYQLDSELEPVVVPRGSKMSTRWYKPELVARAKARREAMRQAEPCAALSAREIDGIARTVVARKLHDYATDAPFFFGVPSEETERVRARIREIATRLGGGR